MNKYWGRVKSYDWMMMSWIETITVYYLRNQSVYSIESLCCLLNIEFHCVFSYDHAHHTTRTDWAVNNRLRIMLWSKSQHTSACELSDSIGDYDQINNITVVFSSTILQNSRRYLTELVSLLFLAFWMSFMYNERPLDPHVVHFPYVSNELRHLLLTHYTIIHSVSFS